MRFRKPTAQSFGLFLFLLFCAAAIAPAVELLDPGSPWPKYRVDRLELPDGVADGKITAFELVDLDGDHHLDLLVAWRTKDEGVLAAYQGGSREWRIEHGAEFLAPVVAARTTTSIRHLAVADMDWDGVPDVIMALEGRSQLDWFSFSAERSVELFEGVPLPGPVTSLAALDYGRRDFAASPVVGVMTAAGPQLALFPDQRAPASQTALLVPSAGVPLEIATGNLDGDAWWDLVVATDRGIRALAGTDSGSRERARDMAVTKVLSSGESIATFALDRFERSTTHRLAVAGTDGIRLVNPKTSDRSSSLKGLARDRAIPWVRSVWSGVGRGPALALPDPKGIRLLGALELSIDGSWQPSELTTLELGGQVLAAETGRISRDGVDDLVVLLEGDIQPVLLVAAPRNTYGVTTEDDHDDGNCDGDCTLREAINAANAHPGYDAIETIPGMISPLFSPVSQLPDLTDTVNLNTLGNSWSIHGSDFWDVTCVGGCNGLVVAADACGATDVYIRYFTKNSSNDLGVGLTYTDSYHPYFSSGSVEGNEGHGVIFSDTNDAFFNGDALGNGEDGIHLEPGPGGLTANNHFSSLRAEGNGESGVRIDNVPDTMIGGTGLADGASLEQNSFAGVSISGIEASGTTMAKLKSFIMVSGNGFHSVYVGSAGATSIGSPVPGATSYFRHNVADGIKIWASSASHQISNCEVKDNGAHGIAIYGSSYVTIGPDVNVGDSTKHGIAITDDGQHPSHNITIEDSKIGTIEGFTVEGNRWFGVDVAGGYSNSIGTEGHGNTIIENWWGGIRIHGAGATGNSIKSNFIGTAPTGADLGNRGAGVVIFEAPSNSVGGDFGSRNVIAYNQGHGITVGGEAAVHVGLRFNSIHDNDGIGIDLGADGVTLPDPGDVDTGPNGLMNQALIVFAESCGGQTFVGGLRYSGAGIFVHDFLGSTTCDPTGWGEGETVYVWFPTSHSSGGTYKFGHSFRGDHTGEGITSMTTDRDSSSSEFSNCKMVTAGRAGDTTADCIFAADDLSGVIRVIDDPAHVTPGNPDTDGDGVVDTTDLTLLAGRVFF